VLVLEKARVAGGNARFSHTGFLSAYSAEDFEIPLPGLSVEELSSYLARWMRDPALRGVLARDSWPALAWMRSVGVSFEYNRNVGGVFEPGLILAARALVATWLRIGGFTLRLGCAVEDVLPGRGVVVGGELVRAPAIIVASGGFQASPDRRLLHLGTAAGVVRGAREDTGEVLDALLAHGAARAGSWSEAVITPVDAASPPVEGGNTMNRYSYTHGITVDLDGERFFDERAGGLADTYSTVGRAILERPGGVAWQLFDAAGEARLKHYAYRHATPVRADTIPELASRTGLDPDALARTVEASGVLSTPPFSAYAVTGGITFTLGGLAIDAHARVLDTNGDPLPGIYATGDALGLFHGGYPSGAGQTRNVVFARRAAKTAVARLRTAARTPR
jgi:tricarballylate dehydrogenase